MPRRFWSIVGSVVVTVGVAACGGHRSNVAGARHAGSGTAVSARGPAGAGSCPVTIPRRWAPPDGVSFRALFGAGYSDGNGKLWVGGLWPHGVIVAGPGLVSRDGSVGVKLGWFRNTPGRLRITGRRVDGQAPPLRAYVPPGYGGRGFQASGVIFSTAGCWQVTGKVGTATLTFVTFVHKILS